MPGPKMGPRPADFDENVIRQAPTFTKWENLAQGEKLRYACRDFIKGRGDDEERLMRRIMIARRNNLRDHRTLKKARMRQAPQPTSAATPAKSTPGKRAAATLRPVRRRRPASCFSDAQVIKEMDTNAVTGTRSYKAWEALKVGQEFFYNQKYTKGEEGHDWLLRKNIWRRMRYRRENKKMVLKLKEEELDHVVVNRKTIGMFPYRNSARRQVQAQQHQLPQPRQSQPLVQVEEQQLEQSHPQQQHPQLELHPQEQPLQQAELHPEQAHHVQQQQHVQQQSLEGTVTMDSDQTQEPAMAQHDKDAFANICAVHLVTGQPLHADPHEATAVLHEPAAATVDVCNPTHDFQVESAAVQAAVAVAESYAKSVVVPSSAGSMDHDNLDVGTAAALDAAARFDPLSGISMDGGVVASTIPVVTTPEEIPVADVAVAQAIPQVVAQAMPQPVAQAVVRAVPQAVPQPATQAMPQPEQEMEKL